MSYTHLGLDYKETNLDDSRKDQILHLGLHQFSTLSSLQVFIYFGAVPQNIYFGILVPWRGIETQALGTESAKS